MNNQLILEYTNIVTEYNNVFREKMKDSDPQLIFLYKDTRHFITRFIERYGDSKEQFTKCLKAFLGMLYVRKNYYLSCTSEQKYKYFNYTIHFTVKNSNRDSIIVGPSQNKLILLQTIIKN